MVERGALGVWVVGEAGAVLVTARGRRVHCFCVRVADPTLPSADRIAHLLLALRADEEGFATVANLAFSGARWRVRRRLPAADAPRAGRRAARSTACRGGPAQVRTAGRWPRGRACRTMLSMTTATASQLSRIILVGERARLGSGQDAPAIRRYRLARLRLTTATGSSGGPTASSICGAATTEADTGRPGQRAAAAGTVSGGARGRRYSVGMEQEARPSLARRAIALAVLLIAGWILLKFVIGLITGIATLVIIVLAIVAVIWALEHALTDRHPTMVYIVIALSFALAGGIVGPDQGQLVLPLVPDLGAVPDPRADRRRALPLRPRRAAPPVPGLRAGLQAPRRDLHALRHRARLPRRVGDPRAAPLPPERRPADTLAPSLCERGPMEGGQSACEQSTPSWSA